MLFRSQKILEINGEHAVYKALQSALKQDKEKFELYTQLIYHQALLMEGLPIDDPLALSNDICKLMV